MVLTWIDWRAIGVERVGAAIVCKAWNIIDEHNKVLNTQVVMDSNAPSVHTPNTWFKINVDVADPESIIYGVLDISSGIIRALF